MKLNKTLTTIATFGLISAFVSMDMARAASTTANALQTVIAALSISKVSDLSFGSAAQSDAAKTIAPGAVENDDNASFTVSGEPGNTYTIELPIDGTVEMVTAGGGSAEKTIGVDSFAAFPTTGTIGVGGNQLLLVGATRDALLANQVTGSYTGAFTVTVTY